jgi:hypothetical protein
MTYFSVIHPDAIPYYNVKHADQVKVFRKDTTGFILGDGDLGT